MAEYVPRCLGGDSLDVGKEELAFQQVADAIAAFERTPQFSRFNSKFDFYLQGKAKFTTQELEGMSVFIRADKGNCAACQTMAANSNQPSLFTDFTYDNIGVSRHPNRHFFAADFVDNALMQTKDDMGLRVNLESLVYAISLTQHRICTMVFSHSNTS